MSERTQKLGRAAPSIAVADRAAAVPFCEAGFGLEVSVVVQDADGRRVDVGQPRGEEQAS